MKLKQRPEDFRVEELTSAVAGDVGEFAFYRLEKTGWTTPDALAAVRRRWQIDFRRLSYGGLKDRHAVTSQYLTIFRGPKRNLSHERIALTYLGQRSSEYSSSDITANRFVITLRALTEEAISLAIRALAVVEDVGLPNYFDDQRFGSVGDPPDFVARQMVLGQFEKALKLALAEPYEFDRADARREKQLLRDHWGNWSRLKTELPRGHARSLVDYLVSHPTDFKGAVARLRPDLQGLYLSAYQSYLWNRMLGTWLMTHLGRDHTIDLETKLGPLPAPSIVPAEKRAAWESLVLPLPSARVKAEPGAEWYSLAEEVLRSEGLMLAEMKVKGMQKPFFSKGERAGCVRPANLLWHEESDALNRGRRSLTLSFDLPRGSYATMLVKRVTCAGPTP